MTDPARGASAGSVRERRRTVWGLTIWPTRRRLALLGVLALVSWAGGGWMIWMPGRSHHGPLPPATAQESDLAVRLRGHVEGLATAIGPRHVGEPDALERSAAYVEARMRSLGLEPSREEFVAGGETVANVVAEARGTDRPEEIVLVGAHYDSVPGCPAANDNASGVAGMLECARELLAAPRRRTLRFVAFVNEEPDWFQTELMGSRVHALRSRRRGDGLVAMLSLETIGCYRDDAGSQAYPAPLGLFYPGEGNFVAFVGNVASRGLVHRVIRSFRGHTAFPSEGAALPGFLPGVGWSDHWAFWQEGYAAVMVTDTAPFRYPHYHRASDTPDRLDFDRMARVVAGVNRVVAELADR